MPVELKKIPEKLTAPKPPKAWRWLATIVLMSVLGVMLSFYFWPTEISTRSMGFWFCTLALPLSAGLAGYAVRLRVYENRRDRVTYWNHLHQQQHDRLVMLGQRAAGLVGKAYITPIACNKLASALLGNGSQLQSQYFVRYQRTLTTARLDTSVTDFSREGYRARLPDYFTRVIHMLEPDLQALPAANLSVRIQHDGSLDNALVAQLWQAAFAAPYTVNDLVLETENEGVMWLDSWLDRREAMLMLSVNINLFSEPRHYQAESVSALLLASPEWLADYDVTPEAIIHRPVVVTEDVHATKDMLCWGSLSADESHTLWRTHVDKDVLARLTWQAESMGYSLGQDEAYILDDLFGSAGAATGNIALICACEHAISCGKPQWVIAENQTAYQLIIRKVDG